MRRTNLAAVVVAVVLCITMGLTGWTTAGVGQAEEIAAALIPAATNILALVAALQGNGVSASDLQTIQTAGTQAGADLQLIQSLITAYQTADAAAKPGILGQIQSGINAVEGSLQGLLPALHIKDAATQAKISAMVGLVLSEVQSLAAIVPLVNPASSTKMMAVAAARAKTQPPLNAGQLLARYNGTLSAKTGNAELDRVTSKMQIHAHGKVARVATAGLLK